MEEKTPKYYDGLEDPRKVEEIVSTSGEPHVNIDCQKVKLQLGEGTPAIGKLDRKPGEVNEELCDQVLDTKQKAEDCTINDSSDPRKAALPVSLSCIRIKSMFAVGDAKYYAASKVGLVLGVIAALIHAAFDALDWFFPLYQKFDEVKIDPLVFEAWNHVVPKGVPIVFVSSLTTNLCSDVVLTIAVSILYMIAWTKFRRFLIAFIFIAPVPAYFFLRASLRNLAPPFNEVYFSILLGWLIAWAFVLSISTLVFPDSKNEH